MSDEKTPQDAQPEASKPSASPKAAKPPAQAKVAANADQPEAKAAGAKAKKEKPPTIEDKPFQEFIQQHYMPSLEGALKDKGIADIHLEFEKRKLAFLTSEPGSEYWQVTGRWQAGQRQFNIAFMKDDISGQKLFACADGGAAPSTVEQFMGDERKITLDLMVLYTLQRLNGQKWLARN